jgi:hypothetical protein
MPSDDWDTTWRGIMLRTSNLRCRVVAALAVGSVSLPATAASAAEPSVQPASKAPTIDLATPAPEPAAGRSYHMHDGFYLRGGFGFGSLDASYDDASASNLDLSGSGFALGLDVMLGGSPSRGVAVGGALLTNGALSAAFDRGGVDAGDRSLGFVLVGPVLDGFPNPRGGWHLGAALGLALLQIEDSSTPTLTNTRGFGGAGWFGYDWWVADEFSTGLSFRLGGALTRDARDGLDVRAQAFGGTVVVSGLYH